MAIKAGKRKNKKWFNPSNISLGWTKDSGQAKRRAAALASRKGNYLKAARALLSLSNVTADADTKRKARADALHFFRLHNKSKKRK